MNTSLDCGEYSMQLNAMGPGFSDFMLDMGMFNIVPTICPVKFIIIDGYFVASCI